MNKLEENLKVLGKISFRDFMQMALYDENYGYYTRNIRTVGRSGDFSTLATINDTLARSICSWIKNRWKQSKIIKGNIIEIGAGDGSLANKVLKNLKLWGRYGLRYHIVETSPKLSQIQKNHLGNRKFIFWHQRMEDALAACSGRALILSNELIDAFPAELIKWNKNEKKWHRVMVELENECWNISLEKSINLMMNHQSPVMKILKMVRSLNDTTILFHGFVIGAFHGNKAICLQLIMVKHFLNCITDAQKEPLGRIFSSNDTKAFRKF